MQSEKPYKAIGYRAKTFRLSLNLMQEDIAKQVGLTAKTISLIENGIARPSAKFTKGMSDHYNMNVNWLFTDEGEPRRQLKAPQKSVEARVGTLEARVEALEALVADLIKKRDLDN